MTATAGQDQEFYELLEEDGVITAKEKEAILAEWEDAGDEAPSDTLDDTIMKQGSRSKDRNLLASFILAVGTPIIVFFGPSSVPKFWLFIALWALVGSLFFWRTTENELRP